MVTHVDLSRISSPTNATIKTNSMEDPLEVSAQSLTSKNLISTDLTLENQLVVNNCYLAHKSASTNGPCTTKRTLAIEVVQGRTVHRSPEEEMPEKKATEILAEEMVDKLRIYPKKESLPNIEEASVDLVED